MTVSPGSAIGILGGGQLGRMLAIAAANLGYRTHIYAPEASGPAADVSARWTQGRYDDAAALTAFASDVAVVSYEFENIPAAGLAALEGRVALHPPPRALAVAQDRADEKRFIETLGVRPAPWRAVDTLDELREALAAIGAPAILKSRRMGYDGKGQARIEREADAEAAWAGIGARPAVLEGFVRFGAEFSILLCRGTDGRIVTWDAPDNVHIGGILATSTVPARPLIRAQEAEAVALATRIAGALDYVGVLAVEFFAADDGPIFNEMAPRVHNSGHWTIEGAITSQFENHVRAICGLPLGSTQRAAPGVEMRNLIGHDADAWAEILGDPGARLHLYGKSEARPGRKMGHVTRLHGL